MEPTVLSQLGTVGLLVTLTTGLPCGLALMCIFSLLPFTPVHYVEGDTDGKTGGGVSILHNFLHLVTKTMLYKGAGVRFCS